MEKYIRFIENRLPSFDKGKTHKYHMFSMSTQHIEADTILELLDAGVKADKELGENSSYLTKLLKDLPEVKPLDSIISSEDAFKNFKENYTNYVKRLFD